MSQTVSADVAGEASGAAEIHSLLATAGYSEKAIRYYIEKPHMGVLPDADHVSAMTGTCGDTMSVCLKVENHIVKDVKYQVLGCAGAVAAAMAAVDLVKGKSVDEALTLTDGDVFTLLEEIPVKKHHCIQLAVKALHKAIKEHIHKNTSKKGHCHAAL